MTLDIITPEKKVYSGEVSLVQVPGTKGSFQILTNHAPIISTLQKGEVRVVDNNNTDTTFNISGGIVEVNKNVITILAEQV